MASARTIAARPLLPAWATAFVRRRFAESIGLALILVAIVLALALLSYQPSDPSWSSATDIRPRNLLGAPGAVIADLLVQTLGLGAGVLVLAIGAWGWRLIRVQRLPLWTWRLALLPVAVLCASLALAFAPVPESWPPPFDVGLGGAIGRLFLAWVLRVSEGSGLGAFGVAIIAGAAASISLFFALAVSWGEWRALGRGGFGIART